MSFIDFHFWIEKKTVIFSFSWIYLILFNLWNFFTYLPKHTYNSCFHNFWDESFFKIFFSISPLFKRNSLWVSILLPLFFSLVLIIHCQSQQNYDRFGIFFGSQNALKVLWFSSMNALRLFFFSFTLRMHFPCNLSKATKRNGLRCTKSKWSVNNFRIYIPVVRLQSWLDKID